MRISDWSSDVCSSDLPPAPDEVRLEGRLLRTGGDPELRRQTAPHKTRRLVRCAFQRPLRGAGTEAEPPRNQIDRSSIERSDHHPVYGARSDRAPDDDRTDEGRVGKESISMLDIQCSP